MTTSVQRRRGSTTQHTAFTGLEGEITIDTTKDTAVVHDGATVGGFPLAKETLENVNTTNLSPIIGTDTAADDTFLIYDISTSAMKKITRAELNNAIEKEPLSNVTINSGSIDGTTVGSTTASSGKFTSLESSSTTTLNGTSIPASKTLLVTTDIGTSLQAYDATILKSANIGSTVQAYDADLTTLGAGGSSARSFLGLAIGTDVQAYDAQLADVAGLTPTDNGVIIGNGANFVVESGATLRTSLGLAIGVDIQAYDADITTIANLSPTNGNVIKGNGTAWNSLPIQTLLTILNRSSATINIALANAFLPVLNRAGSTINVVTS